MKTYYYIYRVGNRIPTVKHYSLESAQAESMRLSVQHPGERFEILKCLGMTKATTPQTFWFGGVTPPNDKEGGDEK